MSNKLGQSIKQQNKRFQQSAQGDQSDNSDQSEDYYEYERKKIQAALSLLKTKQKNSILQQLQKNTANQNQYLDQFQDEVADLHNITRNNDKNVLDESIIKEIKEKVFSQSMLHSIQLSDQVLETKMSKLEAIEKQQKRIKSMNTQKKQVDEVEDKINKKMELARMDRQIVQMSREDQFSMKYEQQVLSDFFSQRFYTPEFKVPQTKKINFKTPDYKPKATFTTLRPLANTENNVLPRNAPELALRRLGKAKKINFVSSSSSEVAIKVKKLNPEEEKAEIKQKTMIQKGQKEQLDEKIESYLASIRPFIPTIHETSKKYRPKFINEYRSQNEQNFNIDDNLSQQKSLKDCIQVQRPQNIKDIKLTFQRMNNLNGIQNYSNIQLAALQFNALNTLNGIQNCQKLIQINLSNNKLKSIDSLKNLKWLRLLNIQHNMVEMIDLKGGFLEILYASNNRIQQIIDLSSNVYLKRLNISNNRLHGFNGLTGLHYLQQIDAHSNYIDNIQGLKQCILLRCLDISNNRLKHLYQNFTFIFLNRLKTSNNSLQQFPNMFLPSLEQLYLDHNKIQAESKSTIYLPNLKVLNLDDNKLSGFSVVWTFLRYSRNLETLKFDKNQYFQNLREKVKELYQFIVYKSMNKLRILNQAAFDIGIKKYYEGVYSNYLTQKQIFKPESATLRQVHKKIIFSIQQNECISSMEDRKIKFSQSQIFVKQKSVTKAEDLIQILEFMENKKNSKIMHATKSVFYEHDKFEYGFRNSLRKISNMIIGKQYRIEKRRKYFRNHKSHLLNLVKYLQGYIIQRRIINAINIFHLPLERMSEQKAAIVIQKNWRCYRLRRKYLKIMKKLRQKDDDSDLEPIDLDQYDFDNYQMYQFNLELPEQLDFDQFIIRPEIFDMINQQEAKREQNIQNRSMVSNGANNQPNNRGNQNRGGQMVNNFMQQNQSHVSDEHAPANRQNARQEKIQKIMKQWGVNREAAIALVAKNELKQDRKRKQAEKNMSAAERYEKLKRNHR